MTVHLCRDFLTQPNALAPGTNLYVMSMFLNHVLGFTVHAQTNFDLSSYQIVAGSPATGASASINQGAGQEYAVNIPASIYTLSSADIGRILVLKSQNFPLHNSGLFRIQSVAGTFATIDYRSSEFPPSDNGINWKIYENEVAASVTGSWNSGSNGRIGEYNTRLTAQASRIILKSPESYSSWLVRLCMESGTDVTSSCPVGMTIAPGLKITDIDTFSDFNEYCLHGPMFYNTSSIVYRGSAVGLQPSLVNNRWARGQWRVFIVGDDETGTTSIVTRLVLPFSGAGSSWASFGIPHDEDPLLKIRYTEKEQFARVFVIGSSVASSSISWRRAGYHTDSDLMGVAWSIAKRPTPLVVSSYTDISNQSIAVRDLSTADNTPFGGGQTELIDVELIAGTLHSMNDVADVPVFGYEPRRMGLVPYVKQGRSNFGNWKVSANASWLHTEGGVYLRWGGPILSGTIAGSSVIELSSSLATFGFGSSTQDANDPSFDPEQEPVVEERADKDAARFRKTYSFYRQEQRIVGVVKMGSNKSKP